MIIGITGGSGTGKSSACKFFRDRGFLIIDSDMVAREVCNPGTPCLEEIVSAFGRGIIDSCGRLKRKELGRVVFEDSEKLKELNAITHKYIVKEIKDIISKNKDADIVIDAPLLFETGLGEVCTKTLCILSGTQKRIERITRRDGISEDDAESRIRSQKDDEFYISRSDYVLYNDSDITELEKGLFGIFGG